MRIYEDQDLPSQASPPFNYEKVGEFVKEISEFRRHRAIEGLVLSYAAELTCLLALKKNEIIRLKIGDVYEPEHGIRDQIPGFERRVGGVLYPLNIPEMVKPSLMAYLQAKFGQEITDTSTPLFPKKNGHFYDERSLSRHLEKFVGHYKSAMTWDKIRRIGICCVYDMALENGMGQIQAMNLASQFGRISQKETFDLLRNRIHFPRHKRTMNFWDLDSKFCTDDEDADENDDLQESESENEHDIKLLPKATRPMEEMDTAAAAADDDEENGDDSDDFNDEGDSGYFFGDND